MKDKQDIYFISDIGKFQSHKNKINKTQNMPNTYTTQDTHVLSLMRHEILHIEEKGQLLNTNYFIYTI
jgi:hypothetical protein